MNRDLFLRRKALHERLHSQLDELVRERIRGLDPRAVRLMSKLDVNRYGDHQDSHICNSNDPKLSFDRWEVCGNHLRLVDNDDYYAVYLPLDVLFDDAAIDKINGLLEEERKRREKELANTAERTKKAELELLQSLKAKYPGM